MFIRGLNVVLIAISIATPALAAADKTCLQNNRIWSWEAVNDQTLILTDRSSARFTVSVSGGCTGLQHYVGAKLNVHTKSALGCLSRGDTIRFDSPGIGPLTCFVNGVQAGAAPAAAATR